MATAIELVNEFLEVVPEAAGRTWLEPAAGTGSFIQAVGVTGVSGKVWAMDIEPKCPGVERGDFLESDPGVTNGVCLTNPPFGRNHSLSVPFFNHAADFCEYVGFIVPRSWRKWSIINRLDSRMHMIYDRDLDVSYQDECGINLVNQKILRTVFQIWQRKEVTRPRIVVPDRGYLTRAEPGAADVCLTVFGRGCGTVSTNFPRVKNTTQMFLRAAPATIEALRAVDLSIFYENVAYIEALSLPEINFCLNEYFDGRSSMAEAA